VLSYIPLNIQKYSTKLKLKFEKEEFKDRVESQDELHSILEKCFKMNEFLDENKFRHIVENICSEPFLFILIFLLDKKPFTKNSLEEFKGRKLKTSLIKLNRTPILQSRLIASPNLQSKFTPSVTIKKSPMMKRRLTLDQVDKKENNKDQSKNYLMQFARKENIGGGNESSGNNPKSVLMKYASAVSGAKAKVEKEEDIFNNTDEGVSLINVHVNRKKRNDLKNLETVECPYKNAMTFSDLPIIPAIKQRFVNDLEEFSR